MIQHAAHHLSFEQILFLNRGPTYIIPGQMHLFQTNRTLTDIITQQVIPLRKQLLQLFSKFSLNPGRQQIFRRAIEHEFFQSFSPSVPTDVQQRAFYEQRLVQSIYLQLKKDQLILRRTADDFNTFFLCNLTEFNQMSEDYIDSNGYFKVYSFIQATISEEQHTKRIVQSIDNTLRKLTKSKQLPSDYFKKLELNNKTNLTLPYLYFLPIPHQNNSFQLQARLSSCKNAPVRTLASFLDRLLRPLFENSCQATTFADGHDFIQKLQYYCGQGGRFTSNTEFVTFELHNLYTRLSHTHLLDALNQFLVQKLPGTRHQSLTIDTIIELTKLALENQIFTYGSKVYQYIKGSPLNYPLTQLLFDIFMQQWQAVLVRHVRLHDLFYGRYHHQGIFTWDNQNPDLHQCIKELNEQNADVQLILSNGNQQVHFLQAHVENRNGELYTCVHHDSTKQPFLLPYTSLYPRIFHRQWFRFRVARVAQYCPSFDDFEDEYLRIEVAFLANGYSLDFVKYLEKQFFQRFNVPNYPFNHNRLNYKLFRHQIFRYFNQKKADLKRERQNEQLFTHPSNVSLYYLYDWGNRIEFNRKVVELWLQIVLQDPRFAEFNLKVFLRCKHCYSTHTLLVRYN